METHQNASRTTLRRQWQPAIGALSFVGGKFWKVARRQNIMIELIVDRIPTTHATL